mmetsp:Transcript_15939/g.29601  ORF Transcript_15939/g.29601 Transcript_15939/m.29601 type:complete len:82 (-) Transcript_15939:1686-1931(-)
MVLLFFGQMRKLQYGDQFIVSALLGLLCHHELILQFEINDAGLSTQNSKHGKQLKIWKKDAENVPIDIVDTYFICENQIYS